LHGLQDGSIYQLLDDSHPAEELQRIAGREGDLQGSYRQLGTSYEHLQDPFRKTVG